jgi:gliding motility-associated-like protein
MILRTTLLLSFCLLVIGSWATHIVGGEINYRYLGSNVYEVELTVFRDCGPTNTLGTGFDEEAIIGFYNLGNGDLQELLYLPLAGAEVEYVPVFLANPCFILPPDVCVERAVYLGQVVLPFNANGYTAVYQRCCRNPSIVNLDFPNGNGTTIYTSIPGTTLVDEQNNDAYFNNYPPVALCRDAEFFFDHSATDLDGDSLSYTLCSPMHGGSQADPAPIPESPPYTEVTWASGFSWDYPIESDPAFAIDAVTGLMTGTATVNGQYVLGVCVNEYRDGVLINSSIRDFQFNVTTCDPTIIAATMDPVTACANEVIQFENESTNATIFLWDFGITSSTDDVSELTAPTFAYEEAGLYTVSLIANPGWFCADTAYTTVNIPTAIFPQIIVGTYECVNDQDVYQFGSTANASTSANYAWDFGAGSVPQFSSAAQPGMVQLNPELGSNTIGLVVTDNGCVDSDEEVIDNPPDPIAAIGPQTTFCDGYDYSFVNNSVNATNYYWNFGTIGIGDVSIFEEPTFTFPDTGVYVISLLTTAPFTCPDSASITIEIHGELEPFFDEPGPQCFMTNNFDWVAQGASTNEADYTWSFENSNMPSSNNIQVFGTHFLEPGTWEVSLTIAENGCLETYTDSVWVVEEFHNEVIFEPSEGCPGESINLQVVSASEVPVYYIWDLGDGDVSYAPALTHAYMEAGTYTIQLEAYTLFGCEQSEEFTLPNVVTIHPAATASFTANPTIVSILNPNVVIQSTSPDATECLYVMSDGSTMESCDGVHSFSQSGIQTITQYAVNEWGCGTSVSGTILVEGFLFFAPNAFTPDGDGVNDVWAPEMIGVEAYKLEIFNRWGVLCYASTDSKKPWTGQAVNDSEHFAPNGVYQYRITAQDLAGEVHEFTGIVSLIR